MLNFAKEKEGEWFRVSGRPIRAWSRARVECWVFVGKDWKRCHMLVDGRNLRNFGLKLSDAQGARTRGVQPLSTSLLNTNTILHVAS